VESPDTVAHRFQHALHLPVTALVDRQLDPRPVDAPQPAEAVWIQLQAGRLEGWIGNFYGETLSRRWPQSICCGNISPTSGFDS